MADVSVPMQISIDETNAKKRADIIVADANTQYSRAALKKLFDMGLILIDDAPARPGSKPKIGQVMTVDLTPIQQEPDVIELPVLYEDDDVIVINKPAGIISHSRGRYWQEASVASFIRHKTRDMEGDRAGIVHRLDRATSGVMIAAKTETTQAFLQKQFADKKVKKEYVALVHGTPDSPKAHIVAPIARNPTLPKQFKVDQSGKEAETTYHVTAQHDSIAQLILTPLTGRTHQLRVHLNYIGHPIVGDTLYCPKDAAESRMYLHAQNLTITLPNGTTQTFTAPLPSEFDSRLKLSE